MSTDSADSPEKQGLVLRLLMEQRANLFAFITALVRDLNVAEEIFQEVAVVICEQWRDFVPGTDFGAWARTIARNKVYSFNKARLRAPILLSPEAIDSLEIAESLDEAPGQDAALGALRMCLARMTGKAKKILAMRYKENAGCARIAGEVGTSVSAVHMLLSRLRARLADCVSARLAERTK